MEFKVYWKKQAEVPESIKKKVDFLESDQENSCGFSIGLGISKRWKLVL